MQRCPSDHPWKKHWPPVTGKGRSNPTAPQLGGSSNVPTSPSGKQRPDAGPGGPDGETPGIHLSQNPKAEMNVYPTLHPNTPEAACRPQPTPTTFLWVEGQERGEGQLLLTQYLLSSEPLQPEYTHALVP